MLNVVFLASFVFLSALNLMDWQLYDLQIHLPGSRSMTPLPARFRTLNTVGSELVRMKKWFLQIRQIFKQLKAKYWPPPPALLTSGIGFPAQCKLSQNII